MPREFYLNIYEDTADIPLFNGDPTYKVGPYKSYEEADDSYFAACFHVKPDYDADGKPINWDYAITTEGEDDEVECEC